MDRLTADTIAISVVAAFALGGFLQTAYDARMSTARARWMLMLMAFGVACAALAALSAAVVSKWWPEEMRRAGPYLREALTGAILLATARFFLWRWR